MTALAAVPQPGDPHARPVRRVWTYRRNEWDPAWYQKLGVPYRGGDEWGRRTLVVGLWFVGYVVVAWRTCWCPECHEVREQTCRFRAEDVAIAEQMLPAGAEVLPPWEDARD